MEWFQIVFIILGAFYLVLTIGFYYFMYSDNTPVAKEEIPLRNFTKNLGLVMMIFGVITLGVYFSIAKIVLS